jgi:hypothetical protein
MAEILENESKNFNLRVKVNCKGPNACSNLGIGNGNLNDGSCGGATGYTGYTGNTGSDSSVCISKCNAICKQIYLEQLVSPNNVSRIGQELIFTYRVTNVSGKKITNPIVISSSLLGSIFVTDRGLDSGNTITITKNYLLKSKDLQENTLTNVAFAAYGVSSGRPGGYNPGERISPVVTATVFVVVPQLEVIGSVTSSSSNNTYNIGLRLNLKNTGGVDIAKFTMNIGQLFSGCKPILNGNPDNVFEIVDNILILKRGSKIVIGQEYSDILIEGFLCDSCCGGCNRKFCTFEYRYQADGGAVIINNVALPHNNN